MYPNITAIQQYTKSFLHWGITYYIANSVGLPKIVNVLTKPLNWVKKNLSLG